MLELLSPAGSPEAVIAAVQSGADIIYIGYGVTGAGKSEMNMGFSVEEFTQSMRYCRVRGCGVAVTMPNGGLEILEKAERGEVDPLDIYAYQYDLVCNGVELSSGAVRNHDPDIMIKAFEMVRLGEDDVKAKFPAMYNAFCYGAPPHAGIAPGVDRMQRTVLRRSRLFHRQYQERRRHPHRRYRYRKR